MPIVFRKLFDLNETLVLNIVTFLKYNNKTLYTFYTRRLGIINSFASKLRNCLFSRPLSTCMAVLFNAIEKPINEIRYGPQTKDGTIRQIYRKTLSQTSFKNF